MLETSKERVRLLKIGFTGPQIEKLYIHFNGLTVRRNNVHKRIDSN